MVGDWELIVLHRSFAAQERWEKHCKYGLIEKTGLKNVLTMIELN